MPLLLIFFAPGGFFVGWAKPVPVNPDNFRNPRSDDIMVTLAGPWMNLLLAIVIMGLARLGYLVHSAGMVEVCLDIARLSLLLCFFNLLPIPPLDGSQVVRALIGMSYETYHQIARYGIFILILVLQIPLVQQTLDRHHQKLLAGHCRLVWHAPVYALNQTCMRTLLLGIDSGTQSTKVLVVDARDGKVLASAAQEYDLIPNLPPGAKEQHPHTWRDATASAIRRALRQAKAVAAEVKAIGVSGQQHGFVPLDKEGEVIRPAKLWCDTSTAAECEEITEKLGGLKKTIRALGNAVLPGFTASKILWLKKHEPKNYQRLATVLLPHDYLNFWLTGEKVMEYGDASGTALLDVRKRKWSSAVLEAIDPELAGKLPPLMRSDRPAGTPAGVHGQAARPEPRRAGQRRRRRQHDGRHRHRQHARGRHHRQLRHQRHHLRLRGEAGR